MEFPGHAKGVRSGPLRYCAPTWLRTANAALIYMASCCQGGRYFTLIAVHVGHYFGTPYAIEVMTAIKE